MHIDKFEDAIMNCRFCFMCRHLSAIGNVRFTEVDTPRIRAAMIYGLRTGTNSFDDGDFVDALYRQDLSACCRHHCVNHFDENVFYLIQEKYHQKLPKYHLHRFYNNQTQLLLLRRIDS